MWLEKLGNDITSMSYDNDYYQGSIETLFAAARKKNFTPPEGYRGALPTLESPWDAVEFAHVIPTEVIGVDGSQVYPDSAEPLPWAYAHAMVTSPSTRYLSRFFSPAELIQEKAASGRKLIDSVRFSLELELGCPRCLGAQGQRSGAPGRSSSPSGTYLTQPGGFGTGASRQGPFGHGRGGGAGGYCGRLYS